MNRVARPHGERWARAGLSVLIASLLAGSASSWSAARGGDEPARVAQSVTTLRTTHDLESDAGLTALHALSLDILRRGLADPDRYERCYAASALAEQDDWSGSDVLEAALAQEQPGLRRAAIDGLGDVGRGRALALLRETYREAEGLGRLMVLQALRSIRDPTVFPLLVEAVGSGDDGLRLQAVENLGLYGDARAIEALRPMLRSAAPASFEQATVAHALLRLGDDAGLSDLLRMVGEATPNVRAAAVLALADAGVDRVVPALRSALQDPSPDVSIAAAAALTHYESREGLPRLVAAIGDSDPITRRHVALLFERLDPTISTEILGHALSSDDVGLQLDAIHAAGLSGREREIERLVSVLETTDQPIVLADVAWALGRLGTRRAIEPLLDMIQHREPAVRHTAADGLARTARSLLRAGEHSTE